MTGSAHIIRGNALALPLPDASVDLVVTSPPYFGLRSYTDTPQLCDRCRELLGEGTAHSYPVTGRPDYDRNLREAWPDWDAHVAEFHQPKHYAGQIGSEATPAEFVDALIAATREMVRVMKPSGSIFVNLGDKYAGGGGYSPDAPSNAGNNRHGDGQGGVRSERNGGKTWGFRPKSLMLLPERYRIACVDQLGLIARAVIVWNKPNGLPESVTDRVRRSHEDWVHLTKQPRYYSAVDEIRETHMDGVHGGGGRVKSAGALLASGDVHRGLTPENSQHPLGKLPGSVWSIPTQPLTVPPELGVDHFAAFPMEWPRRIIAGWSPTGICCVCGEGRRPQAERVSRERHNGGRHPIKAYMDGGHPLIQGNATSALSVRPDFRITGYTCACPNTTAPTRPATVLDPFGGTGTTALVASVMGRTGISVDMSADYCRLAEWRTNDRAQRAAAAQVEKVDPVHPDQLELDLFADEVPA